MLFFKSRICGRFGLFQVCFCYFLSLLILASPNIVSAGSFTVFGPQSFQRTNGSPVTETGSFTAAYPGTPYTAKIYNGGLQDDEITNELVSSGEIKINEVAITSAHNFNQNVGYIEEPVNLQVSNTLAVTLKGKPGGLLTIEIVGIDNDPPTIAAIVDPAPDATGWNNSAVTVHFECSDQISGVASCPEPVLLTAAGGGQLISGTAVDHAGNTATTSITVNIHFDSDNDGIYDETDLCGGTPVGEQADADGCSASQRDTDGDGVSDAADQCQATTLGESVDINGCAASQLDTDVDGVSNAVDQCPDTPVGELADVNGCSASQRDTDGDGVSDAADQCPATTLGESVDINGCAASQLDTDADGISDAADLCPETPAGESPDITGCSATQRDGDGDGISDALDQCPVSTAGEVVDANGCPAGPADADEDGVVDTVDQCPNTPLGDAVYADGCSVTQLDTDGDGIANTMDLCPGTISGEVVDSNGCTQSDAVTLPVDPVEVATSLSIAETTSVYDATAFLYSGNNPIQTGVNPQSIVPEQAAVVRGQVTDRFGNPVVGVKITVDDGPEYGQTYSRADGYLDLAVNGGGLLTLIYEKQGYLTVHRQIDVPWQDYAILPDVVMTPLDSAVTQVQLSGSTEYQIAQGSPVEDMDGIRQATLMFPPGTSAEMVLPGGSTQALSTLSVRATEFTVGENGPQAMPANLPPYTAYTYALELSVDQAMAAGATSVRFNQAVPFYVDNFLNLPVGVPVPVGYYDRELTAWIPSDNGLVIEILGIDAQGQAELDIDGSGQPADAATLSGLGVTSAERTQLATLYSVGKSLWRTPVTHFTPFDCNFAIQIARLQSAIQKPILSSSLPGTKSASGSSLTNPSCRSGSIIECQNQVLRESINLTGAGFGLHYRSDRVKGRIANNTLEIPLTGDTVPPDLKRVEVRVTVGGRVFESTYQPFPNQQHVFIWDGIDAYARHVQGHSKATVRIGYVYDGVYLLPEIPLPFLQRSFSFFPDNDVEISESRQETIFFETRYEQVGTLEAKGLGGWTLDVHHAFDPVAKTLYMGNGERRNNQRIEDRVINYDGGVGFAGEGPINIANVRGFDRYINQVTIAPDSTIYFVETVNNRVRKITRDGTFSTFAGSGAYGFGTGGFSGDGGLATAAELDNPSDVSVTSNGTVFIADSNNHRVRRISPEGIITTVVGDGPTGDNLGENSGDGGQATSARLNTPTAVAVAPDGTLYVASYIDTSTSMGVIRRITPDGIIITIAGGGDVDPISHFQAGNQALSPLEAKLRSINDISVDRNGVVYFLVNRDGTSSQVYRIAGNGNLEHVAGAPSYFNRADDILATEAGLYEAQSIDVQPNGDLYIVESRGLRVSKVSRTGVLTTVLGNGTASSTGSTPTETAVLGPRGVAVAPNGTLIVPYSGNGVGYSSVAGIKMVLAPLPGFDGEDMAIASEDGSLLYQFNKDGRHLRTIDTLTNEDVYVFGYDSLGLLTTVTDFDMNVTTIERFSDGTPIAVISPYGHRTDLSLDAEGYLSTVADPASQSHIMTYGVNGLITEFRRPSGATSLIEYDTLGRLARDENAAGGAWDIAREELDNGYNVSMTTALGRATTHQVENIAEGRKRAVIHPDGTIDRSEFLSGNRDFQYSADGTVTATRRVPDFRWNDQAVIPDTTTTLLSGLSKNVRTIRTRSLNDLTDPLSLREAQFGTLINGDRYYRNVFNTLTSTFTSTTPEQRVTTTIIDGAQRPLFETTDGLATTNYSYDLRGRLEDVVQGIGSDQRSTSYAYNTSGWLDSVTDGLNRATYYDYDLVGRPIRVTLPGGRIVDYSYDQNGNVSSIVPPGRSAHVFNYTPLDQDESYTAPSIGTGITVTQYDYNLDQQLTAVTRPDGSSVSYGYDTGGRLSQEQIPRGISAYAYETQTGQLASITAPGAEGLFFTYDGALLHDESWAGTINGTVSREYNNDFIVSSIAVNGDVINYIYDLDNLLLQAGDLTLTRSPLNGLLTGDSIGNIASQLDYNTVGELTFKSTHHSTIDLYEAGYARDNIGRITQKAEAITGSLLTFDYGYDGAGRLAEVKRDGIVLANYTYDSNSNRIAGFDESGTISATYDAQDRLLSYNGANYDYTANGELLSKTEGGVTTSYQYDVLGNLLQVRLSGETVDYVIDGRNRRIGKKINGALVQGFLYQDSLNPIAELDAQGSVVARFVYGGRSNIPEYMVKGGVTYRIIADHLGSPRLVVNATTGEIVQRMDYDAFGRVLQDTNPGFQPFGFAGGIYDQQTGLMRFGARDYDPVTGRWTSKDPIRFKGGDSNLYGYVLNDPINLLDPNGLITVVEIGVVVALGWGILKGYEFFTEFGEDFETIIDSGQARNDLANGDFSVNANDLQADRFNPVLNTFENGANLNGAIGKFNFSTKVNGAAKAIERCE
jgi:RHS repeat-associated protein